MSTLKITSDNFAAEVLDSKTPVLVDFFADWCGPCKMLGPIVEEISNEMGDAKFCKINIDDEKKLALKFKVMSIPTLVVFKEGKVVASSVGVVPKEDIVSMINSNK